MIITDKNKIDCSLSDEDFVEFLKQSSDDFPSEEEACRAYMLSLKKCNEEENTKDWKRTLKEIREK